MTQDIGKSACCGVLCYPLWGEITLKLIFIIILLAEVKG